MRRGQRFERASAQVSYRDERLVVENGEADTDRLLDR